MEILLNATAPLAYLETLIEASTELDFLINGQKFLCKLPVKIFAFTLDT